MTRHIGFDKNLNNYGKQSDENKEKSNGKALLLGSLAALAIGAGIYIATRGKKTSKSILTTPTSSTPSTPHSTPPVPVKPIPKKEILKDDKGEIIGLIETLENGTSYEFIKSIHPKTKNIVWKYTDTTPDIPKPTNMRIFLDKDGRYTYSLSGPFEKGTMIVKKLEELLGVTLRKKYS